MKKSRHDPDELRRLLAVRKAKNLTFKQLAEESGVAVHVLHHRAHQDDRAARAETDERVGFVEIAAVLPEGIADRCSGIELLFDHGLRVRLERSFDEATLSRLLRVVRC